MENIIRTLCRHLVFIAMTFLFFYIVCVTFTAPTNYTTWDVGARFVFAAMAHVGAVFLHGYWYEHR